MQVSIASMGDWTVNSPESRWNKAVGKIRAPVASLLCKTLHSGNPILHSPAILPSRWPVMLNTSDADIVHLNWVNAEMMSIADIGKIRKPVVWTLHDMWAFSGAEHVSSDRRWSEPYSAANRPKHESGFDLNRWAWERKRRLWKRPMQIVTPSRWMAECVRQSALMCDWPVTVVPNTIDTEVWKPVAKNLARQLLQLPQDVPLLLFGAMGGTQEYHKGFDLLRAALSHLRGQIPGLELVIFGQLAPKEPVDFGYPVHYTGLLYDEISLSLLYSAGDVMVIPSRIDNFPNTGVEAHACGTPVVAFDVCGLPDIVEHRHTGYLARAFDPVDLANGLHWVLQDNTRRDELGKSARERAVKLWSYKTIAPEYLAVYQRTIRNFCG